MVVCGLVEYADCWGWQAKLLNVDWVEMQRPRQKVVKLWEVFVRLGTWSQNGHFARGREVDHQSCGRGS